jgi:hypothetical protein
MMVVVRSLRRSKAERNGESVSQDGKSAADHEA